MEELLNLKLREQIEKHLGDPAELPPRLRSFVAEVDRSLKHFERDQVGLQGKLELSRKETQTLKRDLIRCQKEAHVAGVEQLAVTLRSIGDGVITASSYGEVLLMNRVAEELTGWTQEEAAGQPLEKILHVVDRSPGLGFPNRVEEVSRETLNMSGILIGRDGSERAVSSRMSPMRAQNGRVVGIVIVFRDITDEQRREDERLRASKLESVGLLAGGIAHDFNNFLTAILGNVALARAQLTTDDPNAPHQATELLRRSETAARQARDLTQQLLTFSRGGTPVKKTASARELIQECANFALRGSNVRCDLELTEDLRSVEVDRGQIAQVLHNLIINADQAMPDGGVITIRASNQTIPMADSRPLKAGDYVEIVVLDQGVGIRPDQLGKIFDPYFTTKAKGSGLGLATCYSIAKNHLGWIGVESQVGQGTTFSVYLPAAPRGQTAEKAPEPELSGEFGGRVLLMDDDPAVLGVARDMLQYLGYQPTVAKEGVEMLNIFRRARDEGRKFDIVIMDLTIPGGMGGSEAIGKVLEIDPKARVIVSSGYSNDPIMGDYASFGFRAVLKKPFDVDELSRALEEVRLSKKE